MRADARRTPGDHGTASFIAQQLVDLSQRLLLLVFETLGRLHATLVDLRHRLRNLTRGELSAAAGGQATERVVLVELRRGRLGPARVDLLDHRRQPLGLLGHRLLVTLDELRQHLFAYQLDGLHGAFVAAWVEQQDDLVDAALLITPQELADGGRRADRAAARPVGQRRILLAFFEIALPHAGTSRCVNAGHVIVHDPEREEPAAHPEALHGLLVGLCHHHRQVATDREDVRVDRGGDRHAALLELLVIAVHPFGQRTGAGVGETQGPDALLGGHLDRSRPGAGDPYRRVWLLQRLRDDVTGRHLDVLALESGEGLFDHAADRDLQGLLPLRPLVGGVDVEAAEFSDRGRFAGAEFHSAIRYQVQGGDPLGDPGGMVDRRWQAHDAESQPDVLGPLTGRGQEHLRRGGVAVLLQEVVFGQPDGGEAGLIGLLDLVETFFEQDVLVIGRPRAR